MSNDEKTVSFLTRSLAELRNIQPAVSLRMWYDNNGNLSFFFTNLPPRGRRQQQGEPVRDKTNLPNKDREAAEVPLPTSSKESDLPHIIPSPARDQPPKSPQERKRIGKKRKRQCTSTPEQMRSDFTTAAAQVSFIDQERDEEHVIPSVSCSNSFAALTDLDVEEDSLVALTDLENSSDQQKGSEPGPAIKCSTCEEVLQPVTSKDFYDRMFHLMCCLRMSCEDKSTGNVDRREILKCKCPPPERFVCTDCASGPDCSQWYSRVES